MIAENWTFDEVAQVSSKILESLRKIRISAIGGIIIIIGIIGVSIRSRSAEDLSKMNDVSDCSKAFLGQSSIPVQPECEYSEAAVPSKVVNLRLVYP